MAYIVSKQNRYYVVTYEGLDPTTGKERRRWHLAGDSREDAEAIAANLTRRTDLVREGACSAATVTGFVNDTAHQTVVPGETGLYVACLARLELDRGQLENAREALERAEASDRLRTRRGLNGYERELIAAPRWQFQELQEALR